MGLVTANVKVSGQPIRRAFVEHTGPFGVGTFGFSLTDDNGSFTFDAGLLANRIDVRVYCQNSVVRVLDGGLPVPVPVSQMIFSERFFAFSKQVEPGLTGEALRKAFWRDELGPQRLANVLIDPYDNVGARDNAGRVQPVLTGNDVEGAVYGAIYLDFASRVGLRDAVGLVLDSNATTFDEFKLHVEGRGNATWRTAIRSVKQTWGL